MFKLPRMTMPPVVLLLLVVHFELATTSAQQPASSSIHFKVTNRAQRLEMTVNTSKILSMEYDVPKMLVNNPEIIKATPLSPNQVQVSAVRTGVTQLNLWDESGKVNAVDVLVIGDARELEALLKGQFPTASLKIQPLVNSVVIAGYVPNADMVSRIVRMAEDFYPSVINNMRVGGVQTILLHTKVMEVSRTKMRQVGFDWAHLSGSSFIQQSVSGLLSSATGGLVPTATGVGGQAVSFGVVDGSSAFFGFVQALEERNLAKLLAEPTIVTVSGRPASFLSGGEFPILIPAGLGALAVEYRQFGTRVDFVPIVLGNGRVRLEVRPSVSDIDTSRSITVSGVSVPGLRTRYVDTAVEMKAGQTLALAGLIQNRIQAKHRGLPWLSNLPWLGAAFRRVEEENNEIELLIMVTPEFVDSIDPHEVSPCLPGMNSGSPNDLDLYGRGLIEVPQANRSPRGMPPAVGYEFETAFPSPLQPQEGPVVAPVKSRALPEGISAASSGNANRFRVSDAANRF